MGTKMLETREALGAKEADKGSMRVETEHCSCSMNNSSKDSPMLIEHLQYTRPCTKRVVCIISLNALNNPVM